MSENRKNTASKLLRWLSIALIAAFVAAPALADNGRVTVVSHSSFEKTVENLEGAVGQGGMMVMAKVDQGNMLSMTGLELKAKLFLIGNPMVGKKLFAQDPGVGLYVPLRVFVAESKDGKVVISYDKASSLLGQFENDTIQKTAAMLDQKLAGLVKMAAR